MRPPLHERNLIRSEMGRVVEFAKLALNPHVALRALLPMLEGYGLAHLYSWD